MGPVKAIRNVFSTDWKQRRDKQNKSYLGQQQLEQRLGRNTPQDEKSENESKTGDSYQQSSATPAATYQATYQNSTIELLESTLLEIKATREMKNFAYRSSAIKDCISKYRSAMERHNKTENMYH